MKDTRKGFTLVELLAVIVILAIIMIVAIPSVLDTMDTARRKTFSEYITKVYEAANNLYLDRTGLSGTTVDNCGPSEHNCKMSVTVNGTTSTAYIFAIGDLGMQSTGDYVGYVVVLGTSVNNTKADFFIYLRDNNFETNGIIEYNQESIKSDNLADADSNDDTKYKPVTVTNSTATFSSEWMTALKAGEAGNPKNSTTTSSTSV